MRNKKVLLITVLLSAVFLLVAPAIYAASIPFEPNVKIPNTVFDAPSVPITGASIGQYIVALYQYGATFAGFVAMFMLVYAGWEWLMAAGRLDKIAQAKHTISGVLIGLALLFGSYILMSQISGRLVTFDELNVTAIQEIPGMDKACAQALGNLTPVPLCGGEAIEVKTVAFNTLNCVPTKCADSTNWTCIQSKNGQACKSILVAGENATGGCICVPTSCNLLTSNSCDSYKSADSCVANKCLGQAIVGGVIFDKECGWSNSKCRDLTDIRCDNSSQCDYDNSGKWCCNNREVFRDYCRRVLETNPNMTDATPQEDCKP
ncbi:MAG: hypothetical protein C3F02_02630 [Parcubacteria group bacterium]|nr:MAG: hypothetical protein C3F02_02630 [Parcubacteria group bacterium]